MDTLVILEILHVIQTSQLDCVLFEIVTELREGHIITYEPSKKKIYELLET